MNPPPRPSDESQGTLISSMPLLSLVVAIIVLGHLVAVFFIIYKLMMSDRPSSNRPAASKRINHLK